MIRGRIFILAMTAALLATNFAYAQKTKPNILVIWGDDIGWHNLS